MSKSENAKTLAERAEAEPTQLHQDFAAWIEAKTGIKPDLKTVQLACIFRMEFQASEENQKSLKARKDAAAKKKADAAKAKRARLEKQLAALKADLEKADAEPTAEEMPAEKAAPARRTRKTTPAKASDKPATAPAKASETPAPKRAPRARTRKTAAPATTTK